MNERATLVEHCAENSELFIDAKINSTQLLLTLPSQPHLDDPLMGKKQSRLPKNDREFLLKKTRYTRAELEAWHEGFLVDFPKGFMNLEEFEQVYRKRFPHGDPTELSKHLFRVFDSDGDGKLNFIEFMSNVNIIHRGTMQEKVEAAFKLYDIDGDKKIIRSEMK